MGVYDAQRRLMTPEVKFDREGLGGCRSATAESVSLVDSRWRACLGVVAVAVAVAVVEAAAVDLGSAVVVVAVAVAVGGGSGLESLAEDRG